jgi:hypothetical protein
MKTCPELETAYQLACQTTSDINEHLPVLRLLASLSPSVVELGVRGGVSTIALLAGRPESYIGYDLAVAPPRLKELADMEGVAYQHRIANTLAEINPPSCDLLFIDTLHQGPQVEQELRIFAPGCWRFIACHDTVTFGEHGEGGGEGLWAGIRRWLADSPEWRVLIEYPNNNGLLVLTRDA